MSEQALSKPTVISELTKSPHGLLVEFIPVGWRAAQEDSEFYAHLIAWNYFRGQVRDSKAALPVIQLAVRQAGRAIVENALAHLALLEPHSFVKAMTFASAPVFPTPPPKRQLARLVERYLRDHEANISVFNRTAIQHRKDLKWLYGHARVKPMDRAKAVLFGPGRKDDKDDPRWQLPPGSVFEVIRDLHSMEPEAAAGAIRKWQIPFIVARGAVHEKGNDPDVVMALIERMTPTELVTNTNWLKRVGVKSVPALRAAYEQALDRSGRKKIGHNTLKTTRAAQAMEDDVELAGKLRELQEVQIRTEKSQGGIDGDWLVLADKSGSMEKAIDVANRVASHLAAMVVGKVHLIFFDTVPRYSGTYGATYEELVRRSSLIVANGGTSVGCGVQYLLDNKIPVDGIALVSDGAENTPPTFASTFLRYCAALERQPTVYFYQMPSDDDPRSPTWLASFLRSCAGSDIDLQVFDLRGGVDYYSLPNLVKTMRVGRYALLDEVMNTPLRTLDGVLQRTIGMEVVGDARGTAVV